MAGTKNKNNVFIRGRLQGPFEEIHSLDKGLPIRETYVRTVTYFGTAETEVPIRLSDEALDRYGADWSKDDFVEIEGELHTQNVYDSNDKKIQRRCYVLVKKIRYVVAEDAKFENKVNLHGKISKKGSIFPCRNGTNMFDFVVEVEGEFCIPKIACVIWGRGREKVIEQAPCGTHIEVSGWLKTRDIVDSRGISKKVTEVIVSSFFGDNLWPEDSQ